MATKMKKSEIDLDATLVELYFLFKGKGSLTVYTQASETCDFVDFLNENSAIWESNKVSDKEKAKKFKHKYYTFTDYKEKCTVTINLNDIKYFKIPFFVENDDEIEFKFLEFK